MVIFVEQSEILSQFYALVKIMALIGLLMFVVYFTLAIIASRALKRYFTRLETLFGKIAAGDLTDRIKVKRDDEVGRLMTHLNMATEHSHAMLIALKEEADKMMAIGSELSSNMEETAAAVKEISNNAARVKEQGLMQAAGVTETAATTEQIQEKLDLLVEGITTQSENIRQSSMLITNTAENMLRINKILSQNDTLIKTVYGQMKEGTDGARAANEFITRIAERSEALLEASQISSKEDSIVELIHEQEENGTQVLSAIETINKVTQGVSSASVEMLEGGQQIVTEMQKLADITRETTGSMTEIASGAEHITKAVEAVVSITAENKASIMKLAQEVGKFKIN